MTANPYRSAPPVTDVARWMGDLERRWLALPFDSFQRKWGKFGGRLLLADGTELSVVASPHTGAGGAYAHKSGSRWVEVEVASFGIVVPELKQWMEPRFSPLTPDSTVVYGWVPSADLDDLIAKRGGAVEKENYVDPDPPAPRAPKKRSMQRQKQPKKNPRSVIDGYLKGL